MGPHYAGRRTGETAGTTFRDVRAHHHAAGRHLRPLWGGRRRESRNAHQAHQAHCQMRAGTLRAAPLEQTRCLYVGARKSCGHLLSPDTSRQVNPQRAACS